MSGQDGHGSVEVVVDVVDVVTVAEGVVDVAEEPEGERSAEDVVGTTEEPECGCPVEDGEGSVEDVVDVPAEPNGAGLVVGPAEGP